MDMLNRGIKIVLVSLSLFLCSCKDKEMTKEELKQFDKEQMEKANRKREVYFNYSKALIGEKEYYKIYNAAKDTVMNWTNNNLSYTTMYQSSLILDSLICFNKEKNKCVLALGYNLEAKENHDGIDYFYGAKIKYQWYFFRGAHITLPRDYYQDDVHKPLSLALMKQIAIKEIFSGYLIEIPSDDTFKKGTYKINDSEFIRMEARNGNDGTFGSCSNCKTFEEYVIYLVNLNWKQPNAKGNIEYNNLTAEEKARAGL